MPHLSPAQDLATHRWEHRVLLVMVSDPSSPALLRQLAAWQSQAQGLKERKLVVYQLSPAQARMGLSPHGEWSAPSTLYASYKQQESGFEVVLIGLDGGVKERRTELLPCEELFAIIDGMPMRRAELRKEGNK
ncbi:MAG: DUF4174 domain-containing protein [Bacteroidia bacterium]|nr:DUF4174 domain-containing protein [Bacteroidia bacterium]